MVKQNEEAVKDVVVTQGSSPAEMIRMAVSGGADLDKLEKLLALQERFEANEARKIFARDFAIAQANILPVVKNKYNQQTKSKYADLSDVIETTQPIYTKEGFSVTFDEGESPLPEHTRILADVIHHAGHTRSYHYDVPLDGKGIQGNANMTKIHGKASSTSYGRRYLMCMIWNIPTSDNDGNTIAVEVITEKQLHELRDMIIEKGIETKTGKLCAILKVETLETLPAKDFDRAKQLIKEAKGNGK